jgi:hypothetical protein
LISGQLGSWQWPVVYRRIPALTVLMLFFFFIVRVFLTPKRTAYSSRNEKKHPFCVLVSALFASGLLLTGNIIYSFSD